MEKILVIFITTIFGCVNFLFNTPEDSIDIYSLAEPYTLTLYNDVKTFPVTERKEEFIELDYCYDFPYSDEDIDLIALVTMAEAESESETGKRLVIDTILNRVDSEYFPDNIHDVVYQKNAFTSMYNGRSDKCSINEEIILLVLEEIDDRLDWSVLYFRTNKYSQYGKPKLKEGKHYFSE